MLESSEDKKREDEIAEKICKAWNCNAGRMGPYSPYDRYLYRNQKLSAIIEIKSRNNRLFTSFDTVFINLDKYISLILGELYLRVPSFYIVGFDDGIFYIRAANIQINDVMIKGRTDRPGVNNDIRPAISIPIDKFTKLIEK